MKATTGTSSAPFSPAEAAGDAAWARGVAELNEILIRCQSAAPQLDAELRSDVMRVRASVASLSCEAAASAGSADDVVRRHNVRNVLDAVRQFAELWLEVAAEAPSAAAAGASVAALEGELRRLSALSMQLAAQLDRERAPARSPSAELDDAGEERRTPRRLVGLLGASAADEPAPGGRAARAPEVGSLLVVDDNESNRELLRRRLENQGHAVTLAADGAEAWDLLNARSFDLVLLDVLMPRMNGVEVLQALKAGTPAQRSLPVIMISSLDEVDIVARCIELGADEFLSKPFEPAILRARIGASLEKLRLRQREQSHLLEIERQRRRADELLAALFPDEIVAELKATNRVQPRRFDKVAVLFADVAGFTAYCDRRPPEEVVAKVQEWVETWEAAAERHQVQKIKTIGDALMAAAGLLRPDETPVLSCLRFAHEMIAATAAAGPGWNLRVGIHLGQVVAGVVGRRQYQFDLWGDAVNTASRLESHAQPGEILLSRDAWETVRARVEAVPLGPVPVKGKGEMEMFRVSHLFLSGDDDRSPAPASPASRTRSDRGGP